MLYPIQYRVSALSWSLALGVFVGGNFTATSHCIAGEIKGQIKEVSGNLATVSLASSLRPEIGDKVEVYVELPDGAGVAVLATGKVRELLTGSVQIELERQTGRIAKNHPVRIISAGGASASTPVAPAPVKEPPVLPESSSKAVRTDSSSAVLRGETLANATKRNQNALFLVGTPEQGTGTAFAISRKLRLLATNAHVADIAKVAVLNGTRTEYKVVRKWYHPLVVRTMEDGLTKVHSDNPADGEVDADCPDLALLQLDSLGPDLPAELELAQPQDLLSIQGATVGMLGFPGYQRDQRLTTGLFASATMSQGIVSRLSGFGHSPDAVPAQCRSVQFSAGSYFGFSGSPVFLENGQVVVVNNHVHTEAKGGLEATNAFGVRVDALWELLDHAGMAEVMPNRPEQSVPRSECDVSRHKRQAEALRSAIAKIREAAHEKQHDEFVEARQLLGDAMVLAPQYWKTYAERGYLEDHILIDSDGGLSREQQLSIHRRALADFKKALELFERAHKGTNVKVALDVMRAEISIALLQGGKTEDYVPIRESLTQLLPKAGDQRSYVLAMRGSVNSYLNDFAGGLDDMNEAIRLAPTNPNFYKFRSWIKEKLGQSVSAAKDARYAEELHRQAHLHENHK